MNEEELCERICQLEKSLKNSINKNIIIDKIKYYYDIEDIISAKALEDLLEENNEN